jgi:diguanylate cyclase (GGDEF)-like protein
VANTAPTHKPTPPFVRGRRIGGRIALVIAAVALVIAALFIGLLRPLLRAQAERVVGDQVGLLAEAVSSTYAEATEQGHTKRTQQMLEQLRQAPGIVAIDVADHRGQVVISTRASRVGQQQPLPAQLRSVRSNEDDITVGLNISFTQSCVQCHSDHHDPLGAVFVTTPREEVMQGFDRLQLFVGAALLSSFLLLVVLVIWLVNRMVGKPLFDLAQLMARAEQGDFLVRARVPSDDEVGTLALAFNRLLRAITTLKADEVERESRLRNTEAELAVQAELASVGQRLQDSHEALQKRVRAQEVLMEGAHRLGSTLDKATLIERLVRVLQDKLNRKDIIVYLMVEADHEAMLEPALVLGRCDQPHVRAARFRVGEGAAGTVAETGAPLSIPDLTDPWATLAQVPVSRRQPLLSSGALLAFPMLHKGRVVGVIEFYEERLAGSAEDQQDDMKLLQAMAAQAAIAVVNADLYQTTLELSVTDPLTKLMNRRAFGRLLEAELVRAQRFGTPLALLMIDVDHFKNYNDRMGHLLGDDALRAVARALQSAVRKVDAVARLGGEEFCVLLPRTDAQAAHEVAEKLLKTVRVLELPGADTQPLGRMSISIGSAVYPIDMPPAIDVAPQVAFMDLADKAAYEAKHAGRDRAVASKRR